MYATNPVDAATLFQGDIIAGFPFLTFDKAQSVKKNEAGVFEPDESARDEDRALLAVETKKQRVMILSQSCDVQRRKNVIVCPVYELTTFLSDNTINADRARAIRERRLYYWFYLPAFGVLPESIADLQTMMYVPRADIEVKLPSREISLSDLGRHHLAWSLATFFGRPAED
jgi:hypothetical protein